MRAEIERYAGSTVVQAVNRPAGFSPGLAAKLLLADGRAVFAKAAGSARHAFAPILHRREIEVLRQLPRSVPAPQLIGSFDDDDWVALVCEYVEGHQPAEPWHDTELAAVIATLVHLAETCTPNPIASLPTLAETHAASMNGWRELSE
ncbi:MAG: hypothetical protein HOQ05_11810 [Corynebacteriales bacterium]|nr:hypothetical protein [Mycobacteriales bacterium]